MRRRWKHLGLTIGGAQHETEHDIARRRDISSETEIWCTSVALGPTRSRLGECSAIAVISRVSVSLCMTAFQRRL